MKTIRTFCVILAALFCLVFAFGCGPVHGKVELSENSFFDRFIIHDGKASMLCCLEFVNYTGADQTIEVAAKSPEDAKNGLLKDSSLKLFIINADDLAEVDESNIDRLLEPAESISIAGQGTVRYMACFVGEHGGGLQKYDRELPQISITVLHGQ